jgi:hypothetical protein
MCKIERPAPVTTKKGLSESEQKAVTRIQRSIEKGKPVKTLTKRSSKPKLTDLWQPEEEGCVVCSLMLTFARP